MPGRTDGALGRRIVLVEDDAAVARTVELTLTREGWDIRCAASVSGGVAALGDPFDGLIVDLGLPGGTGWDVVAVAREKRPSAAILIVSGIATDRDAARAQAEGIAYCPKPFGPANLKRFLADCRARQRTAARAGDEIADRFGLSPKERLVLHAAIITTARKAIAKMCRMGVNTVGTHITDILTKTGARSLQGLVLPIRAAAIGAASGVRFATLCL